MNQSGNGREQSRLFLFSDNRNRTDELEECAIGMCLEGAFLCGIMQL